MEPTSLWRRLGEKELEGAARSPEEERCLSTSASQASCPFLSLPPDLALWPHVKQNNLVRLVCLLSSPCLQKHPHLLCRHREVTSPLTAKSP